MLNSSSGHRFKGRARRSDRLELLAGSVERRDLRRRGAGHHHVVVVVRRGREPEDERLTGERLLATKSRQNFLEQLHSFAFPLRTAKLLAW